MGTIDRNLSQKSIDFSQVVVGGTSVRTLKIVVTTGPVASAVTVTNLPLNCNPADVEVENPVGSARTHSASTTVQANTIKRELRFYIAWKPQTFGETLNGTSLSVTCQGDPAGPFVVSTSGLAVAQKVS